MKKKRAILIIILAVLLPVVGVVCALNEETIFDNVSRSEVELGDKNITMNADESSPRAYDVNMDDYIDTDDLDVDVSVKNDGLEDENYGIQPLADSDHVLATNSPYVETTPYGTEADSKYAFSLKWNNNSYITFWQGDDKSPYEGKILYERPSTSSYIMEDILPMDNNLSNNIGCWLYNVGTYKGDIVDVKCTFMWNELIIDGIVCYPLIGIQCSSVTAHIGFDFYNRAYEVKYELYSNGSPISVDMCLTIGDIDAGQFFGFYTQSKINSIQCTPDTIVYFKKLDEYYWMYADSTSSSDGTEATIRYELEDVNTFNVVFGYQWNPDSYPIETWYTQSNTTIKNHTEDIMGIFENTDDGGTISITRRMGVF